MNQNLNLTVYPVKEGENYLLVSFDGELDKAGHAEIHEQLEGIYQNLTVQKLVFDLSGLRFINSEGIGYLMEIHSHLVSKDQELVLLGCRDNIKDIFEAIGLFDIVRVYEDLDAFLADEQKA